MSWLILNIVLGLEVALVYFLGRNVNHFLRAISYVQQWVLPFGKDLEDIREEMTTYTNSLSDTVLPMLHNVRFIIFPITLAVIANLVSSPIVWLPFAASILFSVESILDLYRIDGMSEILILNIDRAEQEVAERADEADLLAQIQEAIDNQ